jgi:hypothetical protein
MSRLLDSLVRVVCGDAEQLRRPVRAADVSREKSARTTHHGTPCVKGRIIYPPRYQLSCLRTAPRREEVEPIRLHANA